ncbi:dihydrolipoyl dehydrogenase family protein [Mesobaculum littorinae]|nr:FAD-dependent oxidoreductase [Mesobaculum littorinae]
MPDPEKFDAIVVGGGSGGLAFAKRAGALGARVLLIERAELGGTCVNRGCVPKKLMWELGRHRRQAVEMEAAGLAPAPQLDYPAFTARRAARIDGIRQSYDAALSDAGVTLLRATARIDAPGEVQADGRRFATDRLVIATGARPTLPPLPGAEHASVSDDVFAWEALPRRIVIVGGGYIGCEFAAILAALGSEVTLVTDEDRLLVGFDEDAAQIAAQNLETAGVSVRLGAPLERISRAVDGGLRVSLDSGLVEEAERVLLAVGRTPNIDDLGALSESLEVADSGALAVSDRLETSVAGVYALGDAADRIPLTPVATRDGTALADTLFGEGGDFADLGLVATTAFVYPPVAQVGRTEAAAREAGTEVEAISDTARDLSSGVLTPEGRDGTQFYKLVRETASGRLIGAALMAYGAEDMIATTGMALASAPDRACVARPTGVHPTFGEELVGPG